MTRPAVFFRRQRPGAGSVRAPLNASFFHPIMVWPPLASADDDLALRVALLQKYSGFQRPSQFGGQRPRSPHHPDNFSGAGAARAPVERYVRKVRLYEGGINDT
jgi:hypothetical protein